MKHWHASIAERRMPFHPLPFVVRVSWYEGDDEQSFLDPSIFVTVVIAGYETLTDAFRALHGLMDWLGATLYIDGNIEMPESVWKYENSAWQEEQP